MNRGACRSLASAAVLAVALLCVDARAASPTVGVTSVDVLLAQAEQAKPVDHAHFLDILKQLRETGEPLTPAQRWHVKFLEAWQHSFEGDYLTADPVLHDIVDHSGDQSLAVRATAILIHENFLSHHYVQAYALANALMAKLPEVTDQAARLVALDEVIQMLSQSEVGQYDLALKYAQEMKASFPSKNGQCIADLSVTKALELTGKLVSTSPEYQQAIDSCLAAGQPMNANAVSLDLASMMIDEGHGRRAIALLERVAPDVRKTHYLPHLASLPVTSAQAYLSLGKNDEARSAALASLAMTGVDSPLWTVKAAYEVLYKVEKRAGHDAEALSYHEKYVTKDKAAMDDSKTRALAYQIVEQQVFDKKLKLDALDKQNKILELRQALADKAQEASRLYIVLLALLTAAIGLWTFRLKYSQLRFRQMARHDGLTGAFNRQHFLHEAARTLRRLEQSDAGACLVVLDLDHFKGINDTYGHAAGDQALKRVVEICRGELRNSDLFGRLGGEEFGILMPACTCEQGIEISGRIRRKLAAAMIKLDPKKTVTVSASLGLAHSAVTGYAFHQLFAAADAALYGAKHAGRNRLMVAAGGDVPALLVDAEVPHTASA